MLPRWWVQEIKRMYLSSLTHGLFITWTQHSLDAGRHVQWYICIQYFMNIVLLSNPPPCFPFPLEMNYPLTYLEIPFLVIVVRMSIHTRPWLMTDCPPLAPHPPFPLPMAPLVHVTCVQRRHHNICYIVWYNCKQNKKPAVSSRLRPYLPLSSTWESSSATLSCLKKFWGVVTYVVSHWPTVYLMTLVLIGFLHSIKSINP